MCFSVLPTKPYTVRRLTFYDGGEEGSEHDNTHDVYFLNVHNTRLLNKLCPNVDGGILIIKGNWSVQVNRSFVGAEPANLGATVTQDAASAVP